MSATQTVAYGLQLQSGFPLPGTKPRVVSGLPVLRIEQAGPSELPHAPEGAAPALPEWSGRLGDGEPLLIERGRSGERVFRYGQRASFHLDGQMETLRCAPATAGLDWQRTLLGKVVPAVSVMRGYEALHAAAVLSPSGAVAIAAPSGTGKTSLALSLIERGWPLVADDVVVLSPAPGGALAHPGTAHVNIDERSAPPPSTNVRTIGVLAGERWSTVTPLAEHAARLRAVFVLVRAPGLACSATRLAASPLPLAPYTLGIAGGEARRASRFGLYAELAAGVPLFRLTAGTGDQPDAIAEILDQALASESRCGRRAA